MQSCDCLQCDQVTLILFSVVCIFIFSHLKLSCGHVAGIVLLAIIKFTQPVLVERESPTSRQDTVKEIQRRAATGGTWPQIVVFTEGTCTNRSCLISFKPGITYFCTTHAVWHDQIYYARAIFLRNFYFLLRYLLLFVLIWALSFSVWCRHLLIRKGTCIHMHVHLSRE